MNKPEKRRGRPQTHEALEAMVREETAYREKRLKHSPFGRKAKKPVNDHQPAPRKNVALVIHSISIGSGVTPQTVIFENPQTGSLLSPMPVGRVQQHAAKAHRVATAILPELKKDKDAARQRKCTARECFIAYFTAIEKMGGIKGLDEKVVRYGRRLQRVKAAQASL